MSDDLVGVWSIDARYGPGAQSDDVLVVAPNGMGWFEQWNFGLGTLDVFEWSLSSPGWVTLAWTLSYEAADFGAPLALVGPHAGGVVHTSWRVGQEEVPAGGRQRVLRLPGVSRQEEAFGALSEDVVARAERLLGELPQ